MPGVQRTASIWHCFLATLLQPKTAGYSFTDWFEILLSKTKLKNLDFMFELNVGLGPDRFAWRSFQHRGIGLGHDIEVLLVKRGPRVREHEHQVKHLL